MLIAWNALYKFSTTFIRQYFPFLFLHFCAPSSSLFCACLWDFYGLIRFCAYTLVIVSLAEGVKAREPRGCQGGTARGYSEGVVSAANLLRLLLTVAMFEGHAGSAKLAKKKNERKKSTGNTHGVWVNVFTFTFMNLSLWVLWVSPSVSVWQPFVSTINSNGTELSAALRLRRRQLPEDDDRGETPYQP